MTQPDSGEKDKYRGPSPASRDQDDGKDVDSAGAATPQFVRGMGLFSATAIVMGSMIGSGIFIVSADMSRTLGSPALLIAAWLVTAVMTVIAALSYGELAAMMPKAGGQYVYLRESLGPLWGFLYGWTLFLVIETGTIAAVGVAFGKFLGVFFPSVSADHWLWHMAHVPAIPVGPMVLGNMEIGVNTANLVAVLIITLLTLLNTFGVKLGASVQNVFTSAKVLSLLAVVAVGLMLYFEHRDGAGLSANFGRNFWDLGKAAYASWFPTRSGQECWLDHQSCVPGPTPLWITAPIAIAILIAIVQTGSLFSADAWNGVTFTAGEIENPKRNLPLSLAIGTGVVLLLYIACNFVYLAALPMAGSPAAATIAGRGIQYAAQDRVATAVMESAFGAVGAKLMAAAILISTFGCANGIILAGARAYYAMSRDGLFFQAAGRLNRAGVPAAALWMQWAWTCVLCLSGSYGQLLDYVIFAVLVFYILTIGGLFVLRRTQPDAPRPYKAFGYPVLPALYIAMAAWICVVLLRYKPQYTWPGLILVLLGLPVYALWRRSDASEAAEQSTS